MSRCKAMVTLEVHTPTAIAVPSTPLPLVCQGWAHSGHFGICTHEPPTFCQQNLTYRALTCATDTSPVPCWSGGIVSASNMCVMPHLPLRMLCCVSPLPLRPAVLCSARCTLTPCEWWWLARAWMSCWLTQRWNPTVSCPLSSAVAPTSAIPHRPAHLHSYQRRVWPRGRGECSSRRV